MATLAFVVTISISIIAEAQWRTNGELVEDTDAQKSVGDFGVMLMLTDDPDGLFEAWSRPPSPDYGPNISEVSTANRGDVILAFILFSGCAENSEGNCDSEVGYTAYFPDGTIYGQHSGPLWAGYPGPGKGALQLSEGNLGLRIEDDDPFGTYKITAKIVDKIAGVEIELSTEVTVVESD